MCHVGGQRSCTECSALEVDGEAGTAAGDDIGSTDGDELVGARSAEADVGVGLIDGSEVAAA